MAIEYIAFMALLAIIVISGLSLVIGPQERGDMGRITRAQYNHILEMRLAGKSLEEIQAYMARCVSPDAYHEDAQEAPQDREDDVED